MSIRPEVVAETAPGHAAKRLPARVLFVQYGEDWIRGTETVLLEVVRRLDRTRFQPYVACNHESLAEAVRAVGVEAFVIDRPTIWIDGLRTRIEPIRWLRTVRALRDLVGRLGVDLLCCMNGQPSMVAYYAGSRGRIPCVSFLQSFYIRRDIHLYRIPSLSAVLFCSDEVRASIVGKARLRGAIHVIHNGVDLTRFRPNDDAEARSHARERAGIPLDRVVVGQVGSMIDRKGVDLLIRAAADLIGAGAPVHVVFVGSGPDADGFTRLAAELGIAGQVTFAGDVRDPAPWYRDIFDINALASRAEAFGLALIEGAASGLPLIAARTGGMQEIVREGVTGLFFEPGDARDLAAKLGRLVGDAELRERLGRAALTDARERFSIEGQVRRIEGVFDETILSASGGEARPERAP